MGKLKVTLSYNLEGVKKHAPQLQRVEYISGIGKRVEQEVWDDPL